MSLEATFSDIKKMGTHYAPMTVLRRMARCSFRESVFVAGLAGALAVAPAADGRAQEQTSADLTTSVVQGSRPTGEASQITATSTSVSLVCWQDGQKVVSQAMPGALQLGTNLAARSLRIGPADGGTTTMVIDMGHALCVVQPTGR